MSQPNSRTVPEKWSTIQYPHFGNLSADEIPDWHDDPHWATSYTYYAEAMQLAAQALRYSKIEGPDSSATKELLEQLGDPSLGVWEGLDAAKRSQEDQGVFLLNEVFIPTLEALTMEGGPPSEAPEKNAILAWYLAFNETSRIARAKLYKDVTGHEPPQDINAWITAISWPEGLRELEYAPRLGTDSRPSLLPTSAPALRQLTSALEHRLMAEKLPDDTFDFDRPFERLLPADIAEVLTERTTRLREYRERLQSQGLSVQGIDSRGFTDILRYGLPVLRKRITQHKSFLLIGPTTTGKTDFSRLAAASIIWQKRKVIVLLPTKALVSQAAEEWRAFFETCKSSAGWRLLEASRDHPFNDEDIARGDYDIVLAIPEKLAAYLAGGSRILDQCGLLVVDELQTLNQRQRGANIESLLTIIRAQYPNLPIIGLSATLTIESSQTLRKWLDVGDTPAEGFIVTESRPVTLDRYAATPDTWRKRTQQDIISDGTWTDLAARRDLREMLRKRLKRAAHRDAVELACRLLLREDATAEGRSILIFVGSRRAAESITVAMQSALDLIDVGEVREWHSPHRGRFGRLVLTEDEALERDKEFFRLPNLPATEDVRQGLSTGVMYHNARLDPEHRRIIEHAFGDKVIRVLVATATLAVGMNLPADFVIVADITEGTSRFESDQPVERLLDPHDIAQRFGRCGRLGMSTAGEAYVLVQRSSGRNRLLQLSADQVKLFDPADDSATPGTTSEALTSTVDEQMAQLDKVFGYFVMSDDTGEPVHSNLDTKGFARLLLQDLCRQAPAVSTAELETRAERIYQHSLLRIEGRAKPDTFELLDMLDSERLIGPAPEDLSKWKITGLGRTVALSNVPITNSKAIREVAEAALLGGGPLTLLNIAAQAEYVRGLSWLRLPHESATEIINQIRGRMWQVVRAFVSPQSANARSYVAPEFLDVIHDEQTLVGYGQSAQALRGRLTLDVDNYSDATVVAHFRACIAILWAKGFPTNSLISFIERNTESTIKGRVRAVDAYPADIRDLGERLSYVLNAASEVLRVDPEDGRHLTLKNLAEALQSGIPYQLAPMLRLRKPRIHRERLVTLLDLREDDLDFDNLPEVLAMLCTPRADRTAQQKRAHLNLAFSEAEIKDILEQMEHSRDREGARALPPELRGAKIPAQRDAEGSLSYGRIASDMARKSSLEARINELVFVLEEFGLRVDRRLDATHAILNLHRDDPAQGVEIYFIDEPVRKPILKGLEAPRRTLVAMAGLTPGAEYSMRSSATPGFNCMTIWVFLAVLARIDRSWRATYFGSDPDSELARRVLRFFGNAMGPVSLSDASLAEVAAGLPAPPPLFVR